MKNSYKTIEAAWILTLLFLVGSTYGQSGTLDTTYNPMVNGNVYAMAAQSDGKAIISGDFTSVNGTTKNGVARLNADGTLDQEFSVGEGANSGFVYDIAIQSDGKLFWWAGFLTSTAPLTAASFG